MTANAEKRRGRTKDQAATTTLESAITDQTERAAPIAVPAGPGFEKPVNGSVTPHLGAADLPTAKSAAGSGQRELEIWIHLHVIRRGITNVKAPIAIGPRYQGLPLSGPARAFDRQIDSWLTLALYCGMIGSGLGEVFLVNLEQSQKAGKVAADNLLLVGLGEPGHFGADDLRFLMANLTFGVKVMGHNHLSTGLIGTHRNELPIDRALRGMLEGVLDGYEHLAAILDGVTSIKVCKRPSRGPCSSPLWKTRSRRSRRFSTPWWPSGTNAPSRVCTWK